MLAGALVLGLTLALQSAQGSPVAEEEGKGAPAQSYRLDFEGTTKAVKAGQTGALRLQIRAAKGYKISGEAPLKIKVRSEGLELEKSELGHGDAQSKEGAAPSFSVGFSAKVAGQQKIKGNAMFFVCTDELCERKTEDFSVVVSVTP